MAEPGEDIGLQRGVVVPASELTWRYTAAGGPGGQHANTSNTRVELVFDVAGSFSLPPWAKTRLIERVGPVVTVVAVDHRSQYQNRRAAMQRLEAALRAGLVVPRNRVATRPTYGSKQRRLDDKRQQSERKAGRRRPDRPSDD